MLALVGACGGGGNDGGSPTPTVGVSLGSAATTVAAGGTTTVNVTVSRGGGYAGNVDLTLEGAPSGITGQFAPASVAGGSTSSVLTITAASTAAAGTANLTVRAKGTGATDATAPLTLTITAASTQSVTLALAPTTVSVAQGGTGTSTLNITRNGGFTGAVTIATSGTLPTGLTVTPASTSVTGNSVALNVAATSAVAAGTYNVTVTASGTGITNQTVTLPVTVTAAAAGSYTIALSPTTVTLAPAGTAGTGTATLNLTRTNFTDSVAIAVSGAPNGLTVTPSAAKTTGNSVTLAVASTTGLAAGSYPVTITTSATGQANQTATLTVTVPAAATGSVAVAVTPTAVSLPAGGGTGTATVNLTRTNFTDSVAIAVTGAPNGLTVTPSANKTTGNSVTLALTSTSALAAGAYPITITTSGTGIANATTTLTVNVAAAVGGFSIAVSPATVNLTRGGSTTVNVDITRTGGFTGPVDVDVTNLPAGVTYTIANATGVRFSRAPLVPGAPRRATSITGNRAVITLTASSTANLGPFALNVTASAAGYPTQTSTSSTITVANPTGGSGNTKFAFCGSNATPIWFAYQDGATGTWTQVTGTNGSFQFDVSQTKAGVAYVTQTSSGYQTLVYYGTAAELGAYGTGQCPGTSTATGKTLTGSVAGLGTASGAGSSVTAFIGTAGAFASVTSPATTFTLNNVPDGARDYLASKVTTSVDLTSGTFSTAVNKLIVRRGQNYTGTIPVFDFGSSEAVDPVARTLTLSGVNAGEATVVGVSYVTNVASTQSATIPLYTSDISTSGATTRTVYTVPTSLQQSGDLHVITAFATPTQATGTSASRGVIKFQAAVASPTLALGPALTAPTVTTLSSTTPLRYRLQAPVQTQYNQIYTANWFQGTGASARSVTVTQTTGYTGGAAWDLSIPDLASAGYNATWGLQAGATTGSTYSAIGYDFNIASGLVDNGTEYIATRTNTSGLTLRASASPSPIPEFLLRQYRAAVGRR